MHFINDFSGDFFYRPDRLNTQTRRKKPQVLYLNRQTTSEVLSAIRVGMWICSEDGRAGKVEQVEVICYRIENHFYFRLHRQKGTVLVIR